MNSHTSCSQCTFFDTHSANGTQAPKTDGLCRFNPPVSQPTPEAHGLWPIVSTNDWCGHFSAGASRSQIPAE